MPLHVPAPISPGAYIGLRRRAAGLSLDDVALMTETAPPVSARARAEWLGLIEADQTPITRDIVIALAGAFRLDRWILVQLVAIHAGGEIGTPQLCVRCGCSALAPCADEHGRGCAWSIDDDALCTACVVDQAEGSFVPAPAHPAPGAAA